MATETSTPTVLMTRPKSSGTGRTRITAAIVCGSGLLWGADTVYKSVSSWSGSTPVVATVIVDRGDIVQVVTENGSIEGSDDDVVRCRVESFLGLPVAPPAGVNNSQAAPTVRPRATATVNSPVTGSIGGATTAAFGAKSRSKSPGDPGQAAATSRRASIPAHAERMPYVEATENNATSSQTAGPESEKAPARPAIRSFEHAVEPHVPLRSTLPGQGVIASTAPPPPTILSIVPEGTHVHAGDVVCELDGSAFRQALDVQKLRHFQAKAWVEQARYLLDANEIALREYEEGILPLDIELVRHYITICESESDRAARNLAWARTAFAKGFRTEAGVEADGAKVQHANINLRDAQGMLKRLMKYTGKKLLKAHRAKIEAIHADLLSLESTFRLESERKARIEAMIANCTMRAPRGGIVVYAHRINGWGTVEAKIREGATVYQSQPIFRLLDPSRMHVKARINESQVAWVKSGQPVSIRLDAFPDRVLHGSVAEIMPIPTLAKGPFSDVRSFIATVRIESGSFDELRSGLTAELEFLVNSRHRVPRVPLEAIRWFDDAPFAAMVHSTTTSGVDWAWQPVKLGASDATFAEVVSGLEPGDQVLAHADGHPGTSRTTPAHDGREDILEASIANH